MDLEGETGGAWGGLSQVTSNPAETTLSLLATCWSERHVPRGWGGLSQVTSNPGETTLSLLATCWSERHVPRCLWRSWAAS